mmetsp:Transcript_128950/g.223715  ORF Transcript_128950/g.223715 Transcript_128950/m.223715 type:complete len:324 (+) Transcript_128950:61-1032(+)
MFKASVFFLCFVAILDAVNARFLRSIRSHAEDGCPSMFVAVLSRKNETKTRSDIRKMWHSAGKAWGATVTAKFAVCRHADEINAPSDKRLQEEVDKFGDVIEMNCTDKYDRGGLTHKVRDIMQVYVKEYMATHPLFMKIDDDTFISPAKLCDLLQENWTELERFEGFQIYMGVFYEQPEWPSALSVPVRDPHSKWYEPHHVYSDKYYPYSAKGGPGYILSGKLVQQFLDLGIAKENMLWNEDKAVGVWVDKVKLQTGMMVEDVNVPGTDGYYFHKPFWQWHTMGNWSSFPYTLFHKLSSGTIKCLHELDAMGDPASMVDSCWQ